MSGYHSDFFVFTEYEGFICHDDQDTAVYGFTPGRDENAILTLPPKNGGCYGVVLQGAVALNGGFMGGNRYWVHRGCWFSTTAGVTMTIPGWAHAVVIQKKGHRGFDAMSQLEDTGRLCYIDGARDTVLQAPWRLGEACLNALYVPAGVHQTMHTHPSTRIGIILDGMGRCETPERVHDMTPGAVFYLPANGWHKFRTDSPDTPFLNLVAYHPDSDMGPTDGEHPMLNRTMVDGVSAKDMPEIQTPRTLTR